ncbi:MAG: DUF1127 domain-containing protein [Pseudomonadota bacterium]
MSLINVIRDAVHAVARTVDQNRAIRQLNAMSDRELRDIGVARAEIEALVTGKIARTGADPVLVRPTGAANRRRAPAVNVAMDAA